MARHRHVKKALETALAADDWRERLDRCGVEPSETMGPLFGLLLHRDELVRWRAAEAFGVLLPKLARQDMEAARRVMRMMLWRMNEESGNIGWGVAEAMGAAMAGHEGLAKEYHSILLSYVRQNAGGFCHGNFLDNAALRRGVYWGIAALAQARPELVRRLVPDLLEVLNPARAAEGRAAAEAMECHDATARGLACLILGLAGAVEAREALSAAGADSGGVRLYWDGRLQDTSVAELADRALAALGPRKAAP